MQISMFIYITISTLIFSQINHPMAMGLMLLIQTLLVCIITGSMSKTFWFSYMLFLIFLGGMLILFIYVTSLASNEMFSLSMKLTTISFIILMIMMCMMMVDKTTIMPFINNTEINQLTNLNSYINENSLNLNKLYNFPTNLMTILLMNYLLLTLIAIVKITNLFYGPLRQMNN
uniref:NADH-ubiquinone oxidoreductase chain 6 n=1 Tax=Trichopsidea sp. TaxID=2885618 RepID=A0A8K1KX76_9MUSC|nr:NADH dehydrogenase subunit 6 [Trichopsidea sp.]